MPDAQAFAMQERRAALVLEWQRAESVQRQQAVVERQAGLTTAVGPPVGRLPKVPAQMV